MSNAAPSARNLAVKHNLNLSLISGTGRQGIITKEDILRVLASETPSRMMNRK